MLPFVEQNPFGILFRPLHDGVGVTLIRTVMNSFRRSGWRNFYALAFELSQSANLRPGEPISNLALRKRMMGRRSTPVHPRTATLQESART